MKKVLGVFVAFLIFGVMMVISNFIRIIRESGNIQAIENGIEPSFFISYIAGVLQIAPLFIAIWLIKFSWKKITINREG